MRRVSAADRRGGHAVDVHTKPVRTGPMAYAPLPGQPSQPVAPVVNKPASENTIKQQEAIRQVLLSAANAVMSSQMNADGSLQLPPLQVTMVGNNNIDLQQSVYGIQNGVAALTAYRKKRGYLFIQNIDAANSVQLFFGNRPVNSNALGVKFGPGAAFLFDSVVPRNAVFASPLPGAVLGAPVSIVVIEG